MIPLGSGDEMKCFISILIKSGNLSFSDIFMW